MTVSSFRFLAKLSPVTSRTLAACDFAFCDAVAAPPAVLEVTGSGAFDRFFGAGVSGGGRLGRAAVASFGAKRC